MLDPKVKEYFRNNMKRFYALQHWKELKQKPYSMNDILTCIYNTGNGSSEEIENIIDKLTAKKKIQGRTQVYNKQESDIVDIVKDENGELVIKGLDAYNPLPLSGQHQKDKNAKIFRKGDDGKINKNFQKAEERMYDLGKEVREFYPEGDNHTITMIMQAVRKFAAINKISTKKIIDRLKRGSYDIDFDTWEITPVIKENIERKTIVINESDISKIVMTPHKFHTQIKRFIAQLLDDPINAQPSELFKFNGYTRSKLLNYLLKRSIINRKQRISDRDENGQPKTATMMVKFICPKKNFDRKLEKLFIELFEKNLLPRKHKETQEVAVLAEEGGATGCCGGTDGMGGEGANGGAFITSMGAVQRRKMPTELDETDIASVGGERGFGYDAPAGLGDKETLKRHNGKGGSVSINDAPRKSHKKV